MAPALDAETLTARQALPRGKHVFFRHLHVFTWHAIRLRAHAQSV